MKSIKLHRKLVPFDLFMTWPQAQQDAWMEKARKINANTIYLSDLLNANAFLQISTFAMLAVVAWKFIPTIAGTFLITSLVVVPLTIFGVLGLLLLAGRFRP